MERVIPIKLLSDLATIPTRGSKYAAGYDLYAATATPIDIAPHSTVKINTDIAVELPEGTFGAVFARSGLSTKKGLRPSNCVGVIDADYRGNIIVALHNDTDEMQSIEPKERVAQFIVMDFNSVIFTPVDELNETERGDGGFGSTGR